jgi:hypothetical protein
MIFPIKKYLSVYISLLITYSLGLLNIWTKVSPKSLINFLSFWCPINQICKKKDKLTHNPLENSCKPIPTLNTSKRAQNSKQEWKKFSMKWLDLR